MLGTAPKCSAQCWLGQRSVCSTAVWTKLKCALNHDVWWKVRGTVHECRLELHCCACLIVLYCACWRAQPGSDCCSDSTVCRHLDEAKHVGLTDAHWHVPNKTTRPLVCVTVKSVSPWTSSIVSIRADWFVPAFMVADLTGTNELLETTTQTCVCRRSTFF